MPTEGTPESDRGTNADSARAAEQAPAPAHAETLARAMAELRSERPRATAEPADRYWLRVGLAVGVAQPGRASLLLSALDVDGRAAPLADAAFVDDEPEATPSGAGESVAAAAAETRPDGAVSAAAEPGHGPAVAPEAEGNPEEDNRAAGDVAPDASTVPVRSMLLARSAALPAAADAETRFGWVSQLTPGEIRRIGHRLAELVASGARRDLERGFGLAWTAGANLPREDLRQLFSRFAELELAVAGVLGGRDLLSMPQTPETGVNALLAVLLPKTSAASAEASSILEREGLPARRGLVAVWNAWVASRYRDRIAPGLFDELVSAWAGVIGPMPEP